MILPKLGIIYANRDRESGHAAMIDEIQITAPTSQQPDPVSYLSYEYEFTLTSHHAMLCHLNHVKQIRNLFSLFQSFALLQYMPL